MRESLGKCGLSKALGGRGNVAIGFCDITIAWSDMRDHFAKVVHALACMIEQATDHT